MMSLLLWSRPSHVKWIAGLVISVIMAVWLMTRAEHDSLPVLITMLFAVTALACISSQPLSRQASFAQVMILLIFGLAMGSLMFRPPVATLLLAGLMTVVAISVWSAAPQQAPLRGSSVVSLAVGALSLLGSVAASDTNSGVVSMVLQLIGYATLLPLFPLHAAVVGSISSLPGTLPAFLVVVLPGLGWYGLARIAPDLPSVIRDVVMILALVGALLAIVRASVQIEVRRIVGLITVALLAAVWWYLGTVGTGAATGWYLTAVTIAASGILMGVHLLEGRYGPLDVERLGGLARPMPRFAVLIGLLFMAAMGLPAFGVSSAFLSMMFAAAFPGPSLMLLLLIWFVGSLVLLKLWHRLFYGPPRGDLLYHDLTAAEVLPFAVMIALLMLGGRLPDGLPPGNPALASPGMPTIPAPAMTAEVPR